MLLLLNLAVSLAVFTAMSTGMEEVEDGSKHNQTCPSWTQLTSNNTCHCGSLLHGILKCDQASMRVEVLKCYCMTKSIRTQESAVGKCPFNCISHKKDNFGLYYKVPKHGNICADHHRQGQLCGSCKENYSVAAYTYDKSCTKCLPHENNWLKFTTVAFAPLTLFFVLMLVFRVNITQRVFGSYVLYAQLVSIPSLTDIIEIKHHRVISSQDKILFFTVYGIWNLDFGRAFYKPFCLHPDLSIHQVVALDYLIAVYPLFLILLIYLFVKLHDKYRLVVIIWRPFYWCVRCIQKEWDIKASLIEVFATFLLLSNVKLLTVSFELISAPVTLWSMSGKAIPGTYTYLNGSMEYLGREHTPYFVLGVAVLLAFNVAPTFLLCLYPFRWFQKCLNRCSLSSPSLHIFMDAFQGCYKTTPRDYRALSSLPFIIILINFVIFFYSINEYFIYLSTAILAVSFITLVFMPYKSRKMNIVAGTMHMLFIAGIITQNTADVPIKSVAYKHIHYAIRSLIHYLPTIIILTVIFHHVIKTLKRKLRKTFVTLNSLASEDREDAPLIKVNT